MIGNSRNELIKVLGARGSRPAVVWPEQVCPQARETGKPTAAAQPSRAAARRGADLTPASVARFSLAHTRCGTVFLLTLMVVSLFFFTILGPLPLAWRLISRVLMLPVLVGIAYEYLRWTADHIKSPLVRFIVKPNLALQSLTTRQPDEQMLEVAITAFQEMRKAEVA